MDSFGGEFGCPIVTNENFVARLCESDALFPNYFGGGNGDGVTIQQMVRQSLMAIWHLAVFMKPGMAKLSATPPSWTDDERHLWFEEEPVSMPSLPSHEAVGRVQQGADAELHVSHSGSRVANQRG